MTTTDHADVLRRAIEAPVERHTTPGSTSFPDFVLVPRETAAAVLGELKQLRDERAVIDTPEFDRLREHVELNLWRANRKPEELAWMAELARSVAESRSAAPQQTEHDVCRSCGRDFTLPYVLRHGDASHCEDCATTYTCACCGEIRKDGSYSEYDNAWICDDCHATLSRGGDLAPQQPEHDGGAT